ncbi:hypothetical protein CVS40_8830 [Lucilia cuprina]|nr:hypothetical protein CVS40_8830 [Lucilia cuprina]
MWRSLVFAALLATTFAFNLPGIPRDFTANDAFWQQYLIEYMKYLKPARKPQYLSKSVQNWLNLTVKDLCLLKKFMNWDNGELNGPNNKEVVKKIVLDICQRLNLQTEEVCSEMFESHWPTTEYIIMNSKEDSRFFCGLFMQWSYCNLNNHTDYEWTLNIDNSAEVITSSKSDFPGRKRLMIKIFYI